MTASMVILFCAAGLANAADGLEFEVASIRLITPDASSVKPHFDCSPAGRFTSSGVPLKFLIEWAYDIRNGFAVPDWAGAGGEAYSIEAKAAGPVEHAACKAMTQRLLEDRFKLALHRETRDTAVYALTIGKGGAKLREDDQGVRMQGRKVSAKGWQPWMLASTLSGLAGIGRPVVDRTRLSGSYSLDLEFSTHPGDDRPDIFTAVQQQLGLKLEPARAPVEFVVIDHLERPSGN